MKKKEILMLEVTETKGGLSYKEKGFKITKEKVPRKKKKKIPKDTNYCYDNNFRLCKYYRFTDCNYVGGCALVKREVLDTVKVCGQKKVK